MSLRLAGWVEVKHPTSYWFREEWAPVINVEPLVEDEQDLHYSAPFADRLPQDEQRLAPGHGLPDDVSAFVAHEAGQWMVPYYASWVTWTELKTLKNYETLPTDWRLVMAMAELLAGVCGDEGVRLILWEYVTDYGAVESTPANGHSSA